jgi:general secretion pathway protein J
MHNNSQPKGFTLLEILIALFIFTIVSVIMVTALHTVLNSQAATDKQAQRLTELQTAMILMANDFEQTINRPITSSKDSIDSFIGTPNSVTFTHAGLANPLGELQRSTLQRVQYSLNKEHLLRLTWPVLEQTTKTQPSQRILLNNVDDLRFEYLNEKGVFQHNWPTADNKSDALPNAVRVTFNINHWGKMSQVYIIPAQTPPTSTATDKQTTTEPTTKPRETTTL